ncbi:hypothetical protein RM550_26150 [Streptomyces sp. DSM 41527]|uniref:Uncharacterized protein n=1 Tax=Streptomyces mooreae TaxID=3075523 RepID=A0ABU2TDY1_9ACTN|nr:hypothetical protein [Streptomyces sp. DSM 41527]MDT0459157.1 hypothetical protein [Streptomyces sp. DSM 41527]
MATVEHTTPASVDPADFVSELHEEGQLPQNAGGDPSVPDSAFPKAHRYTQPAA